MDAKKKRCAKNALMLLLAVGANCLGSFAARHITIPLYQPCFRLSYATSARHSLHI